MKELLRLPDTNTLKVVTNNNERRKTCIIRDDILRNIKKHIMSINDRRKYWKKPKRKRNNRIMRGKRRIDKGTLRIH